MQLGDGRTVVKADEGMVPKPDKRRWLFHFVIQAQSVLAVVGQFQRVPGRRGREKQVLGRDQNGASACPLEFFCRPDLGEYVIAIVRRRGAVVLLGPTPG